MLSSRCLIMLFFIRAGLSLKKDAKGATSMCRTPDTAMVWKSTLLVEFEVIRMLSVGPGTGAVVTAEAIDG